MDENILINDLFDEFWLALEALDLHEVVRGGGLGAI
jgi:hypothetical protein